MVEYNDTKQTHEVPITMKTFTNNTENVQRFINLDFFTSHERFMLPVQIVLNVIIRHMLDPFYGMLNHGDIRYLRGLIGAYTISLFQTSCHKKLCGLILHSASAHFFFIGFYSLL